MTNLCLGVPDPEPASSADNKGGATASSASASTPAASTSSAVERLWACAACTFLNQASDSTCDVCGAARASAAAPPSNWACAACTFENQAQSPACAVCGGAKPKPAASAAAVSSARRRPKTQAQLAREEASELFWHWVADRAVERYGQGVLLGEPWAEAWREWQLYLQRWWRWRR